MWIYIIIPIVVAICFLCFSKSQKTKLFYWTKGIKSEIICEKIIPGSSRYGFHLRPFSPCPETL